jgi:hypothetical protein
MARHKRDYTGEHLTAFFGLHLPPTMLTELKAAAATRGTTTSNLAREILSQHLGNRAIAIAGRPDAETHAKVRGMQTATHAVNALGNLMNQIARHVNTTGELGPFAPDLREAIRTCEHVAVSLLAATEKLIAA